MVIDAGSDRKESEHSEHHMVLYGAVYLLNGQCVHTDLLSYSGHQTWTMEIWKKVIWPDGWGFHFHHLDVVKHRNMWQLGSKLTV